MKYPMQYPQFPLLERYSAGIKEFARLKYEYGADREAIEALLQSVDGQIRQAIGQIMQLPDDAELARQEPDDLDAIRALRPEADRCLWRSFDQARYRDRLAGALMGRMAGCTLGAPVEFWRVEEMRDWAAWIGDPFPPVDYWSAIKRPNEKRYDVSPCQAYTKPGLDGVPVDDDVTYTLLGLLIAEDCGLSFSVEDVGRCWVKYLPYACTAEDVALKNLKAGVPAHQAADIENPFVQWIGADIRSDPWGYLAPGLPEKAAAMAWNDARLSHRRNGIFGEMYFSAVIAAAFACDSPVAALASGLSEIPRDCLLAHDVRWALENGAAMENYEDARRAVQERFGDMSGVHTNLNACLTIFGLMIGGDDFTRCIGETVAMGYDNDCTAATVGSVFGAAKGVAAIPEHWFKLFNNKIMTYLNEHPLFAIDDTLQRFEKLALQQFS
jgi:ADP-ribosylglycohydrolase